MSLFEYKASQHIALEDPPFYALIMAAMRKADNTNLVRLQTVFPDVWDELVKRHAAPEGVLPKENVKIEKCEYCAVNTTKLIWSSKAGRYLCEKCTEAVHNGDYQL